METPATKLETLEKLYQQDLKAWDTNTCTKLNSLSFGPNTEVWNMIECHRQNAEAEGNELLAHIESSLAYESSEVQDFFRSHGITF
jgi:hypothetical protein